MQNFDALGLFTDLYELTMANGIFLSGNNPMCEFYVSFRKNVDRIGYSIFYGIDDFVRDLENFRFSSSDIKYLEGLKQFSPEFLNYLKDFHFTGSIFSFSDGDVVFPYEPVVLVRSNFVECTLLETFILNYLNYSIAVATKASSIVYAAGNRAVMEFGLRRAPTLNAGMIASKAAFVSGCKSTSNTLCAKQNNIPAAGTMAHAWVMSFKTELDAFREFAKIYPDNCILLIDTYDVINSGLKNAIIVGHEMKKKGKRIGVRIDSGDLSYLSRIAREELDKAGLKDAIICLSNDIDEEVLEQLDREGASANSFGIGTKMVVPSSAGCVYKMCAVQDKGGVWQNKMKLSNSVEKLTLPGLNQVYRFYDSKGIMLADMVENTASFKQKSSYLLHHPIKEEQFVLKGYHTVRPMLEQKVKDGKPIYNPLALVDVQKYKIAEFAKLDASHKRRLNPHNYKVSLGDGVFAIRQNILKEQLKAQGE